MKYNVAYDCGEETRHYLQVWVEKDVAELWLDKFLSRYQGKSYPNGAGVYPFTNARLVSR